MGCTLQYTHPWLCAGIPSFSTAGMVLCTSCSTVISQSMEEHRLGCTRGPPMPVEQVVTRGLRLHRLVTLARTRPISASPTAATQGRATRVGSDLIFCAHPIIIPYHSMRVPVIKLRQPFTGCCNQTTDAVCNATVLHVGLTKRQGIRWCFTLPYKRQLDQIAEGFLGGSRSRRRSSIRDYSCTVQ